MSSRADPGTIAKNQVSASTDIANDSAEVDEVAREINDTVSMFRI